MFKKEDKSHGTTRAETKKLEKPATTVQTKAYPDAGAVLMEKTVVEQTHETAKVETPAILALMQEADKSSQQGDYVSATTSLERALRIEPRNAQLYYKLAKVRLQEEQPVLAENLAKKSILLAANDTQLKKQAWLLIAESKRLQGDHEGVLQAEKNAQDL